MCVCLWGIPGGEPNEALGIASNGGHLFERLQSQQWHCGLQLNKARRAAYRVGRGPIHR